MVTVDAGGNTYTVVRELLSVDEMRIVEKLLNEGRAIEVDVRGDCVAS